MTAHPASCVPGHESTDHPILQDLGDGLALVASRCTECATIRFPPRELCVADLAATETIPVSREGVLYEAVSVELAPVGFDAPYWAAYVDMPEGIRVFGPYRSDADPTHGMAVRYSIGVVRTEPAEMLGPVFEPAETSGGG